MKPSKLKSELKKTRAAQQHAAAAVASAQATNREAERRWRTLKGEFRSLRKQVHAQKLAAKESRRTLSDAEALLKGMTRRLVKLEAREKKRLRKKPKAASASRRKPSTPKPPVRKIEPVKQDAA